MYVPIPFYNENSSIGVGYWRIELTSIASDIVNIISVLFPSVSLQVGKTFEYNNYTIHIVNVLYDQTGNLILYVRITPLSTATNAPYTFNSFIFSALGGIGIAGSQFAIKSIYRLDENIFTIIFVYGLIAFIIYKILE